MQGQRTIRRQTQEFSASLYQMSCGPASHSQSAIAGGVQKPPLMVQKISPLLLRRAQGP